MYYIYMLRCVDNSIYTGITTDLNRRMHEHFGKCEKCAKYTRTHDAKKVEKVWNTDNKKHASKLEYHIKKLTKDKKELIILDNNKFSEILGGKIDCSLYKVWSCDSAIE